MKIVVHDYGGYPFPVQLSRSLASRGHEVTHIYCRSLWTTPRAGLEPRADDPHGLTIRPIKLKEDVSKYSFFKRWRQERSYGRLLRGAVAEISPDVVLSGNTPLDAQQALQDYCAQAGIRFVFWLQDVLGVAAHRILRKKLPVVGHVIGNHYMRMERRQLRASDAVVLITDDFRPLMKDWGIDDHRITVIENWSPLDQMPVRPKENEWSQKRGLADKTCFIYTGTLGMKHNPELLLELALRFRERNDFRIVVLSQGMGADWLREEASQEGLPNLLVMDYCPFDELPDVMGTAAVLVALLEPDAGTYSVPSKVLSYLCAGRPLLLAVPKENLAAKIVRSAEAGLVVDPGDSSAFVHAAETLVLADEGIEEMGRRARAHAEEAFNIDRIAEAFLSVLVPGQ
ncbi:MAG: glycosyltransferase family 4 protein [Rhodothermia bacterium]|nr:glycosyltransferase family 4 protein [Rhodothermia bacterium]